ncbi:MAG TPA: carboxypeptidase regulatory-like domain-containing protein, partial [Longimicrobium sp.]|nr:carboxypeptidase regulatory-like domain-containing protein [Longimicrobium sp.]
MAPARAQAVVSGSVREAGGAPVAAAVVQATQAASTARVVATADAQGRYRLVLPAGAYHLKAERVGYFAFSAEVTVENGAELRQDFRLTPRAVELAAVQARMEAPVSRPPAAPTPGGNEEGRLSEFDAWLPVPLGDLEYRAGMHAGVVRLGEGRLSIAGQPGSQTAVTLDGARFGATSLPPDALRATAVITHTYDPSRGQFSGGQIAATTLSGTDLPGGAARARVEGAGAPGGALSRAPGALFEAGGGAGGALVRHRLYAYGALQASVRSTPLVTLGTASGSALRELGVSAGERDRLSALAASAGTRPGLGPAGQTLSRGSALLRLDWRLGARNVAMLRLDGRATHASGVGESPLALAGSGGELTGRSGGAMAQLTSYFGGGRNELRVYGSREWQRFAPYAAGPLAAVRVGGPGADGPEATRTVYFGGSALALPRTHGWQWEASDDVLFSAGPWNGRVKLGALLAMEQATVQGAANPAGTFTFNSLADLEANRPASYVRPLGQPAATLRASSGAVYAAHLLKPRRGVSIIYGVRAEARGYSGAATGGEEPGAAAGAIPGAWGISPRAGFTWEGRAWSLRGGAGEFRGTLTAAILAAEAGAIGPAATRTLVCVGPAAPAPDWAAYAASPSSLPATCAGEAGVFGAAAPSLTRFARGWEAPRTWRGGVGAAWGRPVARLGNVTAGAQATFIRGLAQPLARDAGFAGVAGFALAPEAGRVVFVPPAGVDPATGAVAPGAGRRAGVPGTVREVASGGRGSVAQLSVEAGTLRGADLVHLAYTWTAARDEVGPLAAPGAGSEPLSHAGAGPYRATSDLERRHVVQLSWSRPLRSLPLVLGVAGVLTSGAPYTPRVAGDVDGDGAANDAAFIFDPAAVADPALAAAMRDLLAGAPRGARRCLLRQLGAVAARNSCRTGWSAGVDVQASLWPALGATHPRRFTLTLTASNVLAGADRVLHGGSPRGWGQDPAPDATLLSVRGFDPATRSFRYVVNPGFGRALAGAGARPFSLTLQGRWTVGSDPVRQPLRAAFNAMQAQGRTAGEVRAELGRTLPNVPAQVLSLAGTLRLELSPGQMERLHAAADSLGRALAPLADSLAQAISAA